jgi:chemotaxis protein methyltransferase CheR
MVVQVSFAEEVRTVESPTVQNTLEALEIHLLLEGVYQLCGADFRGYEQARLKPGLAAVMQARGIRTISGLQEQVLHDRSARAALLRALHFQPAALFAQSETMLSLRQTIGPLLRSYADPRVWLIDPGCAEDVFSLAILLAEEGLADRTTIFVTSANEAFLEELKQGRFSAESYSLYEENYQKSGGRLSLANYCIKDNDQYTFRFQLSQNITWAQYNLTTDTSFNAFQLIQCRRPLGDFGIALRHRALALFHESIVQFGVLSLHVPNDFDNMPLARHYKPVTPAHGLYRRIS